MGKALTYCYKCSTLLREDDFAHGKAVRVGDHVACAACAPELPVPTPQPKKPPTSTKVKAPPPAPSTRRVPVARAPNRKPLILGAAVAAGALALIAILALSIGGGSAPEKPAVAEAPPPLKRPDPVDPAKAALDGARRWAREHPADLPGQAREFQRVGLEWEKTPTGQEALREAARIKSELQTQAASALASLEEEIRAPLDRKDYAGALRILEAAEKRLGSPEWELAHGNRMRQIRELRNQKESGLAQGLVAHWAFDEGSGTTAADASGNGHHGRLNGNAAWTAEGKIGGAIRFDGVNSWVEIPNDAGVENVQEESYSLALWFKPEAVPPGQGDQNTASYGLIEKQGWHLGLLYNGAQNFQADHWLDTKTDACAGTWNEAHPPGAFYFVTSVIDRPAGAIRIFVNGLLKNEYRWTANAPTLEYNQNPWRIGMANPGAPTYAWPAKGVIDDVRIYARALSAEDVRNLHESVR